MTETLRDVTYFGKGQELLKDKKMKLHMNVDTMADIAINVALMRYYLEQAKLQLMGKRGKRELRERIDEELLKLEGALAVMEFAFGFRDVISIATEVIHCPGHLLQEVTPPAKGVLH